MNLHLMLANIMAFVLFLTTATQVQAHGMEIVLTSNGDQLSGQVIYSNGQPGVGDFINIVNMSDPSLAPLTATTGAEGRFAVTGIVGHEYVITAHGEEGHTVETQTVLGAASEFRGIGIPFYVIVGILLLLSILPARYLKARSHPKGSE